MWQVAYVSHNLNDECSGLFWENKIMEEERRRKFYGLKNQAKPRKNECFEIEASVNFFA